MALAAVDALHAYLLGAACVGEEERAEKFLRLLKVLDGETIGEGDEAKLEERFGAPGAVWTESEREALRSKFTKAAPPAGKKARRSNQDYVHMRFFLRGQDWADLRAAVGLRNKAAVLMTFCHDLLDLTLPSELTFGMVAAMCSSLLPGASTFEQFQRVQEVKNTWKALSKRWAKLGTVCKGDLLGVLPKTWEELPACIQLKLEKAAVAAQDQWPVSEATILQQYAGNPLRQTHAALAAESGPAPARHRGALERASSSSDLDGALRVLAAVMNHSRDVGGLSNLHIFPQAQRGGACGNGNVAPAVAPTALAIDDVQGDSQNDSQASVRAPATAVTILAPPAARPPPAEGVGQGVVRAPGAGMEEERPAQENEARQMESRRPAKEESAEELAAALEARRQGGTEPPGKKALGPASLGGAKTSKKGPGGPCKKRPAASGERAARGPGAGSAEPIEDGEGGGGDEEELDVPKAPPAGGGGGGRKGNGGGACAAEGGGNQTADNVPHWGRVRAEYYAEKSYIRWWSAEDKKFKMVVSDATKRHRELCRALWPYVLQGKTREELLTLKMEL